MMEEDCIENIFNIVLKIVLKGKLKKNYETYLQMTHS